MKELRNAYRGTNLVTFFEANEFDEIREVEFWEWSIWYAFKNPDAQKKENKISKEAAFKKIMNLFRPTPLSNEVQQQKLQEAHKKTVEEVSIIYQ